MAGASATVQDNRLNYVRSTRFIYTLGQRTMLQAFTWLYKGGPLTSHPGVLKNIDAYGRKQIKKGVNPSQMDITLLYKLLQLKCKLAKEENAWTTVPSSDKDTTLEQALYQLKNPRNILSHPDPEGYIKVSDSQLDDHMHQLTDICTKILQLAGSRANVRQEDVNKAVSKMREDFEQERYSESGLTEAEFLKMCRQELQDQVSLLSPAPFYLPPQLTAENDEAKIPTDIPLSQLLCQMCKDGSPPQLIVVQGETGAGKTSLCRYLMGSWLKDPKSVQRLGEYQLVLSYHCRLINTRDVQYLFRTRVLPSTTSRCTGGELRRILEKLRVLWLLDGWEEAGREGQGLVKELLQTQPASHTVLVASRPEQSAHLTGNSFPQKKFFKALLLGLNDDEREGILRHKLLQDTSQKTKKSIEEFIDYMRGFDTHLKNDLRNPLKLKLAVRLWCESPSKLKPESSLTQLYMFMKDMYLDRLVKRVGEEVAPYEDATAMVDKWFKCFCKVAFDLVKEGSSLYLNSKSENLLKKTSGERTASLCLSTFLEFHYIQDGGSGKRLYVFSHYSHQCFYAALHLNFICCKCPDPDITISNILKAPSGELKNLFDPYIGVYEMFTDLFDLSMIMVSRASFGWVCPQMKNVGFCQSLRRLTTKIINAVKGTNSVEEDTVCGSWDMNRYHPVLLHVLEMKADGSFAAKISAKTLGNLLFVSRDEEVSPKKCFGIVHSSRYQEDLIREVAHRVNTDLWKVEDVDLKAAWELLVHVTPKEVIIIIKNDPKSLSDLEIILFILAKKEVKVHLHLKWHYQCLGSKGSLSDTYLSLLCDNNAKCHLVSFEGHLINSSINRLINLSSWLQKLSLRITKVDAIRSLCSLTPKLRQLQSLTLIYDCPKFVTPDSPLDGTLGFRRFIDGTVFMLMLKGSKRVDISLYLPHLVDATVPAAVKFISGLTRCYNILYVGNLGHNGGKTLIFGLEQNAVHVSNLLKPMYIKEIGRSILVPLGSLPLDIPVKDFVGRWHDISKKNNYQMTRNST